MKASKFCKIEKMTHEEAIDTINQCSWESAAMAMAPCWEVKIIHGKGRNPLGWDACYQIRAASINTTMQGNRYFTHVYDVDGHKILTLAGRCIEAHGFEMPTCSGCELKFENVTMLWYFPTNDKYEYRVWEDYDAIYSEEDEMEDTENE